LRAEPDKLEQRQATDASHGKTDSTGRGSEVGPGMACLKVRQRRGGWRVLERERGGVSQGKAVTRDLSVTLSDSQRSPTASQSWLQTLASQVEPVQYARLAESDTWHVSDKMCRPHDGGPSVISDVQNKNYSFGLMLVSYLKIANV
jgi:hypothetical protein